MSILGNFEFVENGGGEEIDSSVDDIGDERLWLLDVMNCNARIGLGDDATKLERLLPIHLDGHDTRDTAMSIREALELLERKITGYVGVENVDSCWSGLNDSFAEMQ